jgi:hypothetical protein
MAEPVAVMTRRGAAFSMAESVAVSTMIHFEVTFIYLILPKLLSTTQLLHVLSMYHVYVLSCFKYLPAYLSFLSLYYQRVRRVVHSYYTEY